MMSTMTLVLMEALYHHMGEELVIAAGFSSRMKCTTTTTLAHMEMLANTFFYTLFSVIQLIKLLLQIKIMQTRNYLRSSLVAREFIKTGHQEQLLPLPR